MLNSYLLACKHTHLHQQKIELPIVVAVAVSGINSVRFLRS